LPGIVLDKDRVRAALFPSSEIDYSTEQDDLCMQVLVEAAEYILTKDPGKYVLLDGRTFSRRYQVHQIRKLAERLGVPLAIIECVCSDETARLRLASDADTGTHLAANRDYALYVSIRARADPIPEPKLIVDTDRGTEHCVRLCVDYLNDVVRGR
jgi:adenylylsulfate kinase